MRCQPRVEAEELGLRENGRFRTAVTLRPSAQADTESLVDDRTHLRVLTVQPDEGRVDINGTMTMSLESRGLDRLAGTEREKKQPGVPVRFECCDNAAVCIPINVRLVPRLKVTLAARWEVTPGPGVLGHGLSCVNIRSP